LEAETIASGSADSDHAHAHQGSSVNQIRIDPGSKWLLFFVGINLAATVFMCAEWRIAERENRLFEYYVMELDGKLMASGVIKYQDSWSAQKGEHK
jgi:hypothetical protein